MLVGRAIPLGALTSPRGRTSRDSRAHAHRRRWRLEPMTSARPAPTDALRHPMDPYYIPLRLYTPRSPSSPTADTYPSPATRRPRSSRVALFRLPSPPLTGKDPPLAFRHPPPEPSVPTATPSSDPSSDALPPRRPAREHSFGGLRKLRFSVVLAPRRPPDPHQDTASMYAERVASAAAGSGPRRTVRGRRARVRARSGTPRLPALEASAKAAQTSTITLRAPTTLTYAACATSGRLRDSRRTARWK